MCREEAKFHLEPWISQHIPCCRPLSLLIVQLFRKWATRDRYYPGQLTNSSVAPAVRSVLSIYSLVAVHPIPPSVSHAYAPGFECLVDMYVSELLSRCNHTDTAYLESPSLLVTSEGSSMLQTGTMRQDYLLGVIIALVPGATRPAQ